MKKEFSLVLSFLLLYAIACGSSNKHTVSLNQGTIPESTSPPPDCTQLIVPGDSFIQAFSGLSAGSPLCLSDGIYLQTMSIPSNINVKAINDGKAVLDGRSSRGEEWSGGLLQIKGKNSSVRGLRPHHAGAKVNACYIAGNNNTMQVMSCSHGGIHKHKIPLAVSGNGHLIEDSCFYGEGRYVVLCFLGENVTFRRNVARWDLTAPNFFTEPNAAFAIYNCSDVTIENNIRPDYGTLETAMRFG